MRKIFEYIGIIAVAALFIHAAFPQATIGESWNFSQPMRFSNKVTIADGTQHNGYVLTCDANGKASWAAGTSGPTGSTGATGPTGATGATGPT